MKIEGATLICFQNKDTGAKKECMNARPDPFNFREKACQRGWNRLRKLNRERNAVAHSGEFKG